MNGETGFDVIYADPPWTFSGSLPSVTVYKDGSAEYRERPLSEYQYDTMDNNNLRRFFAEDVASLASEDAVLLMWTTDAHLPLALELGGLAGFTYRTVGFIWNKKTARGIQVCFMGKWTMKGSEICLLFAKGAAHSKLLKARNVRQLVEAQRREHSRKPDEVADRINQLFPDAKKIELFARETRPGWSVWGNEASKFDGSHE